VALLNVLDSRQVTPVGGNRPIHVDVRVIASTNRNLPKMIAEGRFREDLYYRLNVFPIHVPPLREHKADIPHLALRFLDEIAASQGRERPKLSVDFMATLMRSDWPGNVRELQNYIERLFAMSRGPVLYPSPPPQDLEERDFSPRRVGGQSLPELVDDLERRMVRDALLRTRGNQSSAAKELGMTEQSIRYRIRKYGLEARQHRRMR
jgi:Nif-specific regulatory protein